MPAYGNYRTWAPRKKRTYRRRSGGRNSATFQAFMRGLRAGRRKRSPTRRRSYSRRY